MPLEDMDKHSRVILADRFESSAGIEFGVVSPSFNDSGSMLRQSSVFATELHKILLVLKETLTVDGEIFVIYIDSETAL